MNPRTLLASLSASEAVSGSDLATRLGVTRAAVWKQIEALRALGVLIEATAGQGYRLMWPLEFLDATLIANELDAGQYRHIGAIDTHWQIDSTNSELLRRATTDPRDLLVCCAETQSAGRGRRERQWRSPLCGNVYFSVLKRFSHGMGALSGLSLAVGIAVIAALTDCGVRDAGLKWPNDVLVDGRKLAGILIELGGEFLGPCHAVVGIGINLRLSSEVKTAIDQPAIDLATLMDGAPPSRNRLAGRLLARLIETLDQFAAQGFAAFRNDYAHHDLLAGHAVVVHTAAGARAGTAEGVDDRGALRVRHGATLAHYDSVEVSVRTT